MNSNDLFRIASLLIVAAGLTSSPASAGPPSLSLPIACTIGPGCQIQNYADDDAGAGARDYACGGLTYDGHKGTDIRLRDVAAITRGVKVLAAADGVVKAVRDDMADISIRAAGPASVTGRECGNGVVIDHGEGWVTQYCHMRRGSIRVHSGAQVTRGDMLGTVGLSGFTEFAHVHFEVRNGAKIINPFTGVALGAAACGSSSGTLWDASAAAALAYKQAAFLAGGFSAAPVTMSDMERGPPAAPISTSSALVAYARVLGVRAGDVEALTVTGPGGRAFAAKGPEPLAKAKVQWLSFAGRKLTSAAWTPGTYSATYSLERQGKKLIDERFTIQLR